MAKKTQALSFKNATITYGDMKITEYGKDDSTEYNLIEVLKEWDGVNGLSLTFKIENSVEGITDSETSDNSDE